MTVPAGATVDSPIDARTYVDNRAWDIHKVDRLVLFGCLLVGLIMGVAQATGFIHDPYDAHMYWDVNLANPYPVDWQGGYVNPPPLAQVVALFHPIGWPLFIIGFTTATWAAFWYLTRALAPVVLLVSLLISPLIGGNVVGYLFLGNIQLLMAAAIVASIRVSGAWAAVPLLVKVIPVSFVWYAVRREWRNLMLGLAATGAIVLVSFLAAPWMWTGFVTFLLTNHVEASPVPIVPIAYPVRLAAAVLLTVWGALTGRRWTMMIAAGIAIPALYVWSFLALWVGVIGIEWPKRDVQT